MGVSGGHYFDFKENFIDVIESLLFPVGVQPDRFDENVHFS